MYLEQSDLILKVMKRMVLYLAPARFRLILLPAVFWKENILFLNLPEAVLLKRTSQESSCEIKAIAIKQYYKVEYQQGLFEYL